MSSGSRTTVHDRSAGRSIDYRRPQVCDGVVVQYNTGRIDRPEEQSERNPGGRSEARLTREEDERGGYRRNEDGRERGVGGGAVRAGDAVATPTSTETLERNR